MKGSAYASALVNHVLGGPAYTPPATVYVALFARLPAADGTGGLEVTGGGYARVAVPNDATHFPPALGGRKTNAVAVVFPTPASAWGPLAGYGIYDGPLAGNPLYLQPVSAPLTVGAGAQIWFGPGDLVIAEA